MLHNTNKSHTSFSEGGSSKCDFYHHTYPGSQIFQICFLACNPPFCLISFLNHYTPLLQISWEITCPSILVWQPTTVEKLKKSYPPTFLGTVSPASLLTLTQLLILYLCTHLAPQLSPFRMLFSPSFSPSYWGWTNSNFTGQ